MGRNVDFVRLSEEVLGIRNAPPALARALVTQALVVGDRRDEWTRAGKRILAAAPSAPGVYVLRDESGTALYVGKANNLKRRLTAHFAPKRWLRLDAQMASVTSAEWRLVGSELEALLVEAEWIATIAPKANVQTGSPSMEGRQLPAGLLHDVLVVLPAGEPGVVSLIAVRVSGQTLIERTRRDGTALSKDVPRVFRFFTRPFVSRHSDPERHLAPIVFSWLAGRGASATRFELRDVTSRQDLHERLRLALADPALFTERLVIRTGSS